MAGPFDVSALDSGSRRRPGRRRLRSAALAGVVVCFAFAAPAKAAKTVVNTLGESGAGGGTNGAGTAGGLFDGNRGVAVNSSGAGGVPAGTFYVVDGNNDRIQQFSPTAEFVRAWGWGVRDDFGEFEVCGAAAQCRAGIAGSGAGQLNAPQGVAVDQSTGVLYVTDQSNRRVDAFSAKGVFEGAFGWGALNGSGSLQFCTEVSGCHAPGGSGAAAGQFGTQLGYSAVDSAGNLYVADKANRRVDVFTPTLSGGVVVGASFFRAFGWGVDTNANEFQTCTVASTCNAGSTAAPGSQAGQFASNSPTDVAVDSAGNVYALDAGNNRVQKFDSTPVPVDGSFGSAALSGAFGGGPLLNVAIGDSDNVLISGNRAADASNPAVEELDPAGAPLEEHGADLSVGTAGRLGSGLAAAPASLGGNIYVSYSAPLIGQLLFVLNEAPTIDPVTVHTGTTADASGEVVSNSLDVTYHFEYSPNGKEWFSFPSPDADAGAAGGRIPVSAELTGLTGSQLYRVRLVQFRPLGGGKATSAETTFTTSPAPPAIADTEADGVTDTKATLRALLNPQNQGTEYRFEYGDQGPCEANPCASTESFDAGSGGGLAAVAKQISGLTPATTYYFRLVATNGSGSTVGEGASFTTYPDQTPDANCPNQPLRSGASAALPDCRAYELVTPEDPGGHSPTYQVTNGEPQNFPTPLAAPDGESVLFKTRLGALPGTDGSGVADLYNARRGVGGWSTGLLGPSGAVSENPKPGGFSADHEFGFFRFAGTRGSLDGEGLEGGAGYLRSPGGFEPIGRGAVNGEELVDTKTVTGYWITTSGAHIVFGSKAHLSPDAPPAGENAVYERSLDGPTQLVARFPGGAPVAESSWFQGVSADGSAVLFSTPNIEVNSSTKLYARIDGTESMAVADGAAGKVTPAGVSADGAWVFYVQNGDVYSFDTDVETTTPVTAVGDARLVNISADGSRVYFISNQQIGGEGEIGEPNLYVWQRAGNSTRLVATVLPGDLGTSITPGLTHWTSDVATPLFGTNVGPLKETSRTNPDGGVLVFQSKAQLTGYENDGHTEIYRYAAEEGLLSCLSCDPSGAGPPQGDASLASSNTSSLGTLPMSPIAVMPNVSDDGKTVFFESEAALVPGDIDSVRDVYEWHDGRLSLISSGHSAVPNYLYGATPNGHDVFFLTHDELVPRDHSNGAGAIYDARVGGGFAEPLGPASCQGDACQGSFSSAPGSPGAASAVFSGPGNVSPKRRKHRCSKAGRIVHRRHGKGCTRKHKAKHGRKARHRRGHPDRRADR